MRRWAGAAGIVLLAGCGAQDGSSAAGELVPPSASAVPKVTAVADRDGVACPTSDLAATAVPGGLPALTLSCLGPGPDVNLAGLRGVPAVVNVWASWCAPCRKETPLLVAVAEAAGPRLNVLGIDVQDDRPAGMAFAAAGPFASVYDPDGATRASLGWTGPPMTLLVGADGVIKHRIIGQIPDEQSLRSAIDTYLGVDLGA